MKNKKWIIWNKKIVLVIDENKNLEENQKNKVLKGIIRKKNH